MTQSEAVSQAFDGPGRVLVVDDDPRMRFSVEGILELEFVVTTADSVASAKAALRAQEFDVVLTDYEMPGGSGLDLVRLVNAEYPGVMVILLTGHPDAEVARSESTQAIVRVLTKPYDAKRLISWIASTVKLARMSRMTSNLSKSRRA